jgi:hypothetical protein
MATADFTVRILRPNPHREGSTSWRAGQIVTGMEGCRVDNIVRALTALAEDTSDVGVGDPSRWLTHFAGLESPESGKHMEPWIEIVHRGQPVLSTASYRELLRGTEQRHEGQSLGELGARLDVQSEGTSGVRALKPVTEVVEAIIAAARAKGEFRAPGLAPFKYVRETAHTVIVLRQNGEEAKIAKSTLEDAVNGVRAEHRLYDAGPGALREIEISHVNSPVYALLRLLPLNELIK